MDINALRETVAAATPGPWRHWPEAALRIDSDPDQETVVGEYSWGMELSREDGDFIATFDPQMVGALLDVVEAAEAFGWSSTSSEGLALGDAIKRLRALT